MRNDYLCPKCVHCVAENWDITAGVDDETDLSPIDVRITVAENPNDSVEVATFEVSVHNKSDERVTITSGVPAPFGILRLVGENKNITLWSSAYESDKVYKNGREVTGRVKSKTITRVSPNEKVSESYSIRSDEHTFQSQGITDGEYRIVSYRTEDITVDEKSVGITVSVRGPPPAPEDGGYAL